jgi:hypothetical protein
VGLDVAAGIVHEELLVTANNRCGPSPVKVIHFWGHPTRPVVTGPSCVTANQQNVAFNVTNAEADAVYTWTVFYKATIINGQGTPSVTVEWGNAERINVVGSNVCASTATTGTLVPPCGPVTSTLVHVFPNPASSSAQISFTANKETKYIIELTDKTGRMLQRKELIANAGENKLTLDLGKYTNGTYFVNVVGEDRRRTAQIIKTN